MDLYTRDEYPQLSLLTYANMVSQTEVILPQELFEIVSDNVLRDCRPPAYSRLILPLSALLQGQFFNEYVKKGKLQPQR